MSGAGDLERFPLEIRKEIYKFVLLENKPIAIKRYMKPKDHRKGEVVRMDHHRKASHRGKIWNARKKTMFDAPPGPTSILFVNRAIGQETKPLLYSNDFAFENARALEAFLIWIGSSRQYLRKIVMMHHGTIFNGSWKALDRSLTLLTAAKNFRTLEFSHLAFCGAPSSVRLEPRLLANHCMPFLRSLQEARSTLGLNSSILEVIKILLPPCHCSSCGKIFRKGVQVECCNTPGSPHQYHQLRMIPAFVVPRANELKLLCDCICEQAEDTNRRLMREVGEVIVEQLGLNKNNE